MTQRPDVDQAQLEQMLRRSSLATACACCPAGTRRTTRRVADGQLEVRCVGCGSVLGTAPPASAPGDLP
ncbi:MAG: hypothetical protein IPN77_15745 [Sandaracinaceae bacterium]|nr:hypothetical protein [Sandaracinaceae bacterium]MBP7684872.1 hypothetical protein [Deltaproteobacteria bacterium]